MKETEEKQKQCPFNPELKCENCRLYGKTAQGWRCVFKSIQWAVDGIDMFGGK